METIEDEDEPVNKNIAPQNKTRVIELANGDDDDSDDLPNHIQVPAKNVSLHILIFIRKKKYLSIYLKRTALRVTIRLSKVQITRTQHHLTMRRSIPWMLMIARRPLLSLQTLN
jgi:hypothetical protein